MRATVTAILVARDAGDYLTQTLSALRAQTRTPERLIVVELGDGSKLSSTAAVDYQRVQAPASYGFGAAVQAAVQLLGPAESDDQWLWLLGADNAPEPTALAALLGEVEISPSVAVAGPKQMQWNDPDYIVSFGDTLTPSGMAVEIAEPELDQAQYDRESDVLAVAAGGMLVRQSLFERLEGFDPGLPAVDDALDFCVRARLAGHRVVVVPAARVRAAGRDAPGTAHLGRRTSANKRARLVRTAQLHRRLAYAPAAAVPLHWLSLLPLALIRAVGQLLSKRPGRVLGEFGAALAVAFGHTGSVLEARRRIARHRVAGWAAIAPLRLPWAEVRRRRALARDDQAARRRSGRHDIDFFAGGGAWTVLIAAVVGAIVNIPVFGGAAVQAAGLLPLSPIAALWSGVGYGWRSTGGGFVGASDPFNWLLALLGSLTPWATSTSIVILYIAAMPLAALAAWLTAARITARPGIRVFAAVVWTLAPPFLIALQDGRLGAVLAHLLLPWLALALLSARRSWSAAATAGLLAAGVTAGAPSLLPGLLVLWAIAVIGFAVSGRGGRGWHRLLPLPIPAAALFLPLAIQQALRGTPLGVLADPGVAVIQPGGDGSAARLAEVGRLLAFDPVSTTVWSDLGRSFGVDLPHGLAVAVLAAPLLLIAIAAVFLPRSTRAIASLGAAGVGFATAVLASRLVTTAVAGDPVTVWTGSAVSLYLLGILGAAVVGLDAVAGRAATAVRRTVSTLAAIGVVVAAVPLLIVSMMGGGAVAGGAATVPALVAAEAVTDPTIGTLVLSPGADGIAARLERGAGDALDERTTLAATARAGDLSADDERVAVLVGNLASRSGFDPVPDLEALRIGFVLLSSADPDGSALRARAAAALDGNSLFTPVTSTSFGTLWRYVGLDAGLTTPAPVGPGPLDTSLGVIILLSQALVLLSTLLLALPTGTLAERVRPERRSRRAGGRRRVRPDPASARTATVDRAAPRSSADPAADTPDAVADPATGSTHADGDDASAGLVTTPSGGRS